MNFANENFAEEKLVIPIYTNTFIPDIHSHFFPDHYVWFLNLNFEYSIKIFQLANIKTTIILFVCPPKIA